jgi:hypothetical protein
MGTRGKTKNVERSEENSDEGGVPANSALFEMMKTMSGQLTSINSKLEKMDSIETEVRNLKIILNDLKAENKQLKSDARDTEKKLADMNERNNFLENKLNKLEQHHRGWSIRVMNVPISKEEETSNDVVRDKIYNLALLPIFRGAVEKRLIQAVPSAEHLIEMAHVLPGKAGQPKPVIVRFYNRNMRDICFKLKKHYAPREGRANAGGGAGGGGAWGAAGGATGGGQGEEQAGGFEGKGKYSFPIYEDLTRATFLKMRAIANDSRVKACWSIKGQIKFTLVSKPDEVKKVESLLDSLESILK